MQLVSNSQLSKHAQKIGKLDERLGMVERDLKTRPTKEDIHQQQIDITRMQERIKHIESTTTATNHAITRIENFLISLSKRQ